MPSKVSKENFVISISSVVSRMFDLVRHRCQAIQAGPADTLLPPLKGPFLPRTSLPASLLHFGRKDND